MVMKMLEQIRRRTVLMAPEWYHCGAEAGRK
jgi:hypothetical protein